MLINALLVFIGSGLGGALRYLVGANVETYSESVALYSTFIVNVLGCFGLAALLAYKDAGVIPPSLLIFLGTGFFGGFTTYSTYNYETFHLFVKGEWGAGTLYASLTIVAGIIGAILGTMSVNAFAPHTGG